MKEIKKDAQELADAGNLYELESWESELLRCLGNVDKLEGGDVFIKVNAPGDDERRVCFHVRLDTISLREMDARLDLMMENTDCTNIKDIAYGITCTKDLLNFFDRMRLRMRKHPKSEVFLEGADAGFVTCSSVGDVAFFEFDSLFSDNGMSSDVLPLANCEDIHFTREELILIFPPQQVEDYDKDGNPKLDEEGKPVMRTESEQEVIDNCLHGGSITEHKHDDGRITYTYHG